MKRFWRWFRWRILGDRCKCGGKLDARVTGMGVHETCVECGSHYYETSY